MIKYFRVGFYIETLNHFFFFLVMSLGELSFHVELYNKVISNKNILKNR